MVLSSRPKEEKQPCIWLIGVLRRSSKNGVHVTVAELFGRFRISRWVLETGSGTGNYIEEVEHTDQR
jgi:hypothetical protein